MKKEPKKNKTTFSITEVSALIEDLRSQFRFFGEDLSFVKSRLDNFFEELGKQKETIFVIKADTSILKKDAAVLKEDVCVLKKDVKEIKELLTGHTKRIAHLEEVSLK